MLMMEHRKAIKALKLFLEHAWLTNNFAAEMITYDKLSVCYFYLGELDKSKYYKLKHTKGLGEEEGNKIREVYKAVRKNYALAKRGRESNMDTPEINYKTIF